MAPDTTPPQQVTGLQATVIGPNQINLAWNVGIDPTVSGETRSGIKNYDIFRGGLFLTTVTTTTFQNTGLTPDTPYSYTVRARDVANNEGAFSAAAAATTQVLNSPDTTPPTDPTIVSVSASDSTHVNISWTVSTDPTVSGQVRSGLAGYKVYRNGTVRTTTGLVTSFADNTVVANTTYNYRVSAIDNEGNESNLSPVVSVTTPGGTFSLDVSWTKATQNDDGSPIGTILSHNIYASQTPGAPYEVVQNDPGSTTSGVLVLPSGGTWYVVVKTVTAQGESATASAETSRVANVS